MSTYSKIAVSLPFPIYTKLEALMQETGLTRSGVITLVIQTFNSTLSLDPELELPPGKSVKFNISIPNTTLTKLDDIALGTGGNRSRALAIVVYTFPLGEPKDSKKLL